MKTKKVIIRGWNDAGEIFLAEKLKKVFCLLDTPEDVALHNDMVEDVMIMVGDKPNYFRRIVARIILSKPGDYLRRIAHFTLNLSKKGS